MIPSTFSINNSDIMDSLATNVLVSEYCLIYLSFSHSMSLINFVLSVMVSLGENKVFSYCIISMWNAGATIKIYRGQKQRQSTPIFWNLLSLRIFPFIIYKVSAHRTLHSPFLFRYQPLAGSKVWDLLVLTMFLIRCDNRKVNNSL